MEIFYAESFLLTVFKNHFRVLGKPPEAEWPKTDVSIKWNSFDVVNHVKIKDICPNICDTALDLIMVCNLLF